MEREVMEVGVAWGNPQDYVWVHQTPTLSEVNLLEERQVITPTQRRTAIDNSNSDYPLMLSVEVMPGEEKRVKTLEMAQAIAETLGTVRDNVRLHPDAAKLLDADAA
ncbi:MAG: hypothetical protein WA843_04470 [Candidatus Saccharimonadales bacterium]